MLCLIGAGGGAGGSGRWSFCLLGAGGVLGWAPLSIQLPELFSPPFSARLFGFCQGETSSNQEGSADFVTSFALNSEFFTGQSSEGTGSF